MRATLPLAVLALAAPLWAQDPTPPPQLSAARAQAARNTLAEWLAPHQIAVPRTLDVNGSRPAHELAVVWEEPAAAERNDARVPDEQPKGGARQVELRIARRVESGGRMPRLRSLDIGEGQLLAAAVDTAGALRGVAIIADPRVVRAEWPGADGVLTGQTLRLARAEFLLPLPDDPNVVAVRLFEPHRTGEAVVLRPIAFVRVSGGADR